MAFEKTTFGICWALLCNVEIKDTDTNDQIKEKIEPTVDLVTNKKKASSAASVMSQRPSTYGLIRAPVIGEPDPVNPPSIQSPLPAFREDQVPWGMTVGPEGQPTFQMEDNMEWVMTPEFYQLNDENDPQL